MCLGHAPKLGVRISIAIDFDFIEVRYFIYLSCGILTYKRFRIPDLSIRVLPAKQSPENEFFFPFTALELKKVVDITCLDELTLLLGSTLSLLSEWKAD